MAEEAEGIGAWIKLGGVPVNLLSGMLDTGANPPPAFVSKFRFEKSDLYSRIDAIDWFSRCGDALSIELTMGIRLVRGWPDAIASCKAEEWSDAQREAENQLTLYLHGHDHAKYQEWNTIVDLHWNSIVDRIIDEKILPFQRRHQLDEAVLWNVKGGLTSALMENSYIDCGHSAFFFLELLGVYEAGHFPCGWEGKWPDGKLLVY